MILNDKEIQKNETKIRQYLKENNLYSNDKELDSEYTRELELLYRKPKEQHYNMPYPVGKAVLGYAGYEAMQSELKALESKKSEMKFVGFSIYNNDLLEYYVKDNLLYTFLYNYIITKKKTNKMLSCVMIDEEEKGDEC